MNNEQIKAAREALDSMDDYARMESGVDAAGPRGVLVAFIDLAEAGNPASVATPAAAVAEGTIDTPEFRELLDHYGKTGSRIQEAQEIISHIDAAITAASQKAREEAADDINRHTATINRLLGEIERTMKIVRGLETQRTAGGDAAAKAARDYLECVNDSPAATLDFATAEAHTRHDRARAALQKALYGSVGQPVPEAAAQADSVGFDECCATGQSCQYGAHGREGEMQCKYCGKEQPTIETDATPAPVSAAEPCAEPQDELHALRRLIECAEILDKRPRPMCRDCADEDGTCPSGGLDCDMRKLFATVKSLYNRLASLLSAGAPTCMGYVATDLNGHAGIGFTIEEAKKRAPAGCNTVFPVFDIGAAKVFKMPDISKEWCEKMVATEIEADCNISAGAPVSGAEQADLRQTQAETADVQELPALSDEELLRLPKLPHALYEEYPAMSAAGHEAAVKDYARAALATAMRSRPLTGSSWTVTQL